MLIERGSKSLEPDIARRLSRHWPAAPEQAEARRLLATYGEAEHESDVVRVQLAILKLSVGSLQELAAMTAAAKLDYRDVVAWAEYPEELRASWSSRPTLAESERRDLKHMRARDRAQYEAWLADEHER
jgi:hypothetical protein